MTAWARLALALLVLWAPGRAYASCCSSSTAGGVARLLNHERGALLISSTAKYRAGFFDYRGHFYVLSARHLPHFLFEEKIHVITRIIDQVQPYVTMPILTQVSAENVGANFGDVAVGFRSQWWRDGEFGLLPGMQVIVGAHLPTGVNALEDSRAEFITSMGLYKINGSVSIEKSFFHHTFGLSYGLTWPIETEPGFAGGQTHAATLTWGLGLTDRQNLDCSITEEVVAPQSFRGQKNEDSVKWKTSLQGSYAITVHSHLKAILNGGFDVPLAHLGKNTKSEWFLGLGIRVGVF